ncbi:M61 family peptidase [uncultured Roseivirga sp.]|uniref:M61 family metallopeptidase n=1 Tax=uncultured Roseivirga sp. TaxID=543088 RepID=UPI0030DADAB8|tara:strand:- start:834 stop:2312 length:1479 start_codon:yes stop_codon:yes gene_type:complete
MQYSISYTNPNKHIIDITLKLSEVNSEELNLFLPAWRPGRYTIQNFAKHILNLKAYDENGIELSREKVTKDQWSVKVGSSKTVEVKYSYYAFQMDAGNSWLDDEQLYLNFINCLVYTEGRLNERCEVEIHVPTDYQFATGLTQTGVQKFETDSFYHLVDSPLVAAKKVRKIEYKVSTTTFYLWIIGELPRTDVEVIRDFRKFTELQIEVMGEFPSSDYHFIYQCLPYKHYHGVEHWNSTMITIGPAAELKDRPLYKEFLGVSSHELFHTWNVIRLRPKEMTPYDFQHENYHETGFVTEGVTTYYGDLFLKRSGVFSLEEYLGELNKLLERHYLNEGRNNMSVASSSFDLWLDGYEKGVPGRKVSIYNEGALLALILDLKIRLRSGHQRSLDDVMRLMWQRFGKNQAGYTYQDYQNVCEEVYGVSLQDYFENYVSGTSPLENELKELFPQFGLSFNLKRAEKLEEKIYGLKLAEQEGRISLMPLRQILQQSSC